MTKLPRLLKLILNPECWIWLLLTLAALGGLAGCQDAMKSPNDYYNEGVKSGMDSAKKIIDSLKMDISVAPQPYAVHDTVYVPAKSAVHISPQTSADVVVQPADFDEEMVVWHKLGREYWDMIGRLDCHCPKAGDSYDNCWEILDKMHEMPVGKYFTYLSNKDEVDYKTKMCK